MYVRVRSYNGKPEAVIVVESKLSKIDQLRPIIKDKFGVNVDQQLLIFGGKLLGNGYTLHDYNIKHNDVIQLIPSCPNKINDTAKSSDQETTKQIKNVEYKDATSTFYTVGDLIDMKDREQGTWFEGKIVRIVCDPNTQTSNEEIVSSSSENKTSNEEIVSSSSENKTSSAQDGDSENKPQLDSSNTETPETKLKGIAKYFSKSSNVKKKTDKEQSKSGDTTKKTDGHVLYKVELDDYEEESTYCKFNEIRPRARKEIPVKDLKPNMTVMINHNTENVTEKGYWYDFTVNEVKKLRTSYELIGTLYLGPDSVPENEAIVRVHDKIFAIEQAVPLDQRTEEYTNGLAIEKRAYPLNCLKCRDNEDKLCKWCGCFLCKGKENPEKIVLCDECNNGYHMKCLDPPLTTLPEDDWYCSSCKRDTNHVIAPGASKQAKKTNSSKSTRDWGRGMACVGTTKKCSMPRNHSGPIPGVEVGMRWRYRIQTSECGVHRPPVSGIHGRDTEGAYSIVLSGGYEDDVDNGNEFTYTGSGGRDLSGNKRTAGQSSDQTLTRENRALARNCAAGQISEKGGDAGDNWRKGKPVRVLRTYKMLKHFPKYAPKEGIRYDGIYKVVKYYSEVGLSGFRVWKYLLRRDDPSPAPWEPGAEKFPLVFPDGFLEAEVEKQAAKEKASGKVKNSVKKRTLFESNESFDKADVTSPPSKKLKVEDPVAKNGGNPSKKDTTERIQPVVVLKDIYAKSQAKTPLKKCKENVSAKKDATIECFVVLKEIHNKPQAPTKTPEKTVETLLSSKIMDAIKADTLNEKLWSECLKICEKKGKKEFVEHVTEVFLCIICQDVAAKPVTTPCLHNFCMGCLKLAFKSTSSQSCPYCRQSLAKSEPAYNENLKAALQAILPGYDVGKK